MRIPLASQHQNAKNSKFPLWIVLFDGLSPPFDIVSVRKFPFPELTRYSLAVVLLELDGPQAKPDRCRQALGCTQQCEPYCAREHNTVAGE